MENITNATSIIYDKAPLLGIACVAGVPLLATMIVYLITIGCMIGNTPINYRLPKCIVLAYSILKSFGGWILLIWATIYCTFKILHQHILNCFALTDILIRAGFAADLFIVFGLVYYLM